MKICGAVLLAIVLLGLAKFWPRKIFLLLTVGAAVCLLAAAMSELGGEPQTLTSIAKNEAGGGELRKDLVAAVEDEEVEVSVTVPALEYTNEEIIAILEEERRQLPERILGRNESFDEIRYDLELPEKGMNPAVEIFWSSSDMNVIDWHGRLQDAIPAAGRAVQLTAHLQMGEENCELTQAMKVFPKAASGDLKTDLETELRRQNADETAGEYVLPEEVNGSPVTWTEKAEDSAAALAVLLLLTGFLLFLSERQKEDKKRKERQERLTKEYPELISRLVMLLYAGTSLRNAFYRIAGAYQKEKKEQNGFVRNEAFEEVVTVCREVENGVLETKAYANMADRCALPAYRTLSVLLAQNQKKGSAGILHTLEQEVFTAFGEKKRRTRMAGDAASMKLLLPMGLMMMVVFMIIMIPAFLSL